MQELRSAKKYTYSSTIANSDNKAKTCWSITSNKKQSKKSHHKVNNIDPHLFNEFFLSISDSMRSTIDQICSSCRSFCKATLKMVYASSKIIPV